MALFNKNNVPISTPVQQGQSNNNYSGELSKIMELVLNTGRTTSGNITWTSPTSNITYNTSDSSYASIGGINNSGETGLYNLLIYLYGNKSDSQNSFVLTAENFNAIITEVQNIVNGTTPVGSATLATKASKLSNTSAIGGSTTPVYFTSNGVPTACTSYANASVSQATKDGSGNTITSTYKTINSLKSKGNATTPVYFDSNGNAVACTAYANASVSYATTAGTATSATSATSATTATTATKLGSSNLGSATKPIYLAAGTPTEGSNYAGGSVVSLNGTSKAGDTASFYAPVGSGTAGYILKSGGPNTAPSWTQTVPVANGGTGRTALTGSTSLRNDLGLGTGSGALAVANGGTGATTFTSGNLLVGNGTSAVGSIAKASANTANTVVVRDANGGFSAGVIDASVTKDGDGNTIASTYAIALSGTSAPNNNNGKNGDIYIQYSR